MSKQEHTSLWDRVRRFWGASGDGRSADEAPGDEDDPGNENPPGNAHGSSFSPLDLRDRVVVMLLFDQVVRIEQVATAWRYQQEHPDEAPQALWRMVARLPEVDAEAIFAKAAQVYAFEPVDFNMYGASGLIRKRRQTFTRAQWERMVALNVAPVRTEYDDEKDATCWVFATHDPARPAVQRLLAGLDVPSHTLRYAPREQLEQVFDDALPRLARERSAAPAPSDLPEEPPSREESRRILENLTHGASPPEREPRDASPADEAPTSPADLFDQVLAGIVQSSARAAYLFAGAQGQLEIYHRQRRTLRHWRTEAHVPADAMIDFISGRILSLRAAQERSGEAVEHWVAGRPVEFRPSIEPAHALGEDLPAQEGTEVVVIEMLR